MQKKATKGNHSMHIATGHTVRHTHTHRQLNTQNRAAKTNDQTNCFVHMKWKRKSIGRIRHRTTHSFSHTHNRVTDEKSRRVEERERGETKNATRQSKNTKSQTNNKYAGTPPTRCISLFSLHAHLHEG